MVDIVVVQMLLMFTLMLIGYFLFKTKYLNEDGAQQISNIIFQVCTPIIMINAFSIPFSWVTVNAFVQAATLSIISIIVAIVIGYFIFGMKKRIEFFSVIFSNSGFIGIPLVSSILGNDAVFYVTAFIIIFNLALWTIGVYIMTSRKDLVSVKSILKGPAFIGLFVGIILFILPVELPSFLNQAIDHVVGVNTILAMIVLGLYVAKTPIKSIFSLNNIWVSVVRLLIVPIAVIVVLRFIPIGDPTIKMAVLIASSAPVGVMAALFSQKYNDDYEYGAGIVSMSSILSTVTLPIVIAIAGVVW